MFCPDGKYNTPAALWLQVPEASVRSFFHDPSGSIQLDVHICSFFTGGNGTD